MSSCARVMLSSMTPQFTPEALRAVAAFLPVMADPAFRFTDGQPPAVVLPGGGVQMRGYAYDPQVARLLTVFARQERFSDGSRLGFWESGLLLGILRRAAALAQAAG